MSNIDVNALRGILPKVEAQQGQWDDELLGRYLCAVHGHGFRSATYGPTKDGWFAIHSFHDGQGHELYSGPRRTLPDTSLDAANKLCEELGYERTSGKSLTTAPRKWAHIDSPTNVGYSAWHPTRECAAILLALGRALMAKENNDG